MKSLKSLVVEDDIVMQKIMHKFLKHLGTCDIANDGLEGLEQVKASIVKNEYYDLICTDIRMPRMDGTELIRMIRSLESDHVLDINCVIIVITAFNDEEVIKKCSELGCSSFLIKPIDKDNLLNALKNHKLVAKDYFFPLPE